MRRVAVLAGLVAVRAAAARQARADRRGGFRLVRAQSRTAINPYSGKRVVDVDNMHVGTSHHELRRRESDTINGRRARHSLKRREAAEDPGPHALQLKPLKEFNGNRRRDQELESRIHKL